jgi:hypothetical protein
VQITESGLNERVRVRIEYIDGSFEYITMTRREAYQLQDQVAAGNKPNIRSVGF